MLTDLQETTAGRIPGLRIEAAGRLEPVCLLEGGERLFIVAAGLAIDLAGGKVRAIEQYFLFYDRRSARSTRPALARRRGELRIVDGLRIKCRCRGVRGGAPCAVPRGVGRVGHQQSCPKECRGAGPAGAAADQKCAKHSNDPQRPEGPRMPM